MTFGKAFGHLIRKRRGVEGLTQQELAVKAFGDEGHKARISELENGKVERPHSKTVDALVLALGVEDSELTEILNENPHPKMVDTLVDYFDPGSDGKVEVEIGVTAERTAFFIHTHPWKFEPSRFEYFREDNVLVVLVKSGSRRPAGMPLAPEIAEVLVSLDSIYVVKEDDFIKKLLDRGNSYPLIII